MKKLSIFFIKSFVGPFLATFFISMFMLVMQFLWKYIDDLMGKGLEITIILELLFYVSASLLPLALPLAILLSSLRSEERRVGKECRCRWWRYYYKNKL